MTPTTTMMMMMMKRKKTPTTLVAALLQSLKHPIQKRREKTNQSSPEPSAKL